MYKYTLLFIAFPFLQLFSQNVGINTTEPMATLHINGDLKFEPKVTIDATRLVGVKLDGKVKEFPLSDTFNINEGTLEVNETVEPNIFLIGDLDMSGDAPTTSQYDNFEINLSSSNQEKAVIRFSGETNGFTVSGFKDGYDGRIVYFYNAQNVNVTFFNLNSGSNSENQIITGSGANVGINNQGVAEFMYDGSIEKWILVNIRS